MATTNNRDLANAIDASGLTVRELTALSGLSFVTCWRASQGTLPMSLRTRAVLKTVLRDTLKRKRLAIREAEQGLSIPAPTF